MAGDWETAGVDGGSRTGEGSLPSREREGKVVGVGSGVVKSEDLVVSEVVTLV